MENGSKALLIAGAILICILIVAIGMFIYNNASSKTVSSLNSLSTQEIESFNKQFDIYSGLQKGSQIKNMISAVINNASINKEESVKLPGVAINKCVASDTKATHAAVPENSDIGIYIDTLTTIKNKVDKNHEYWVELSYQKNGFIDYITITYDPNNIEAIYTRDHLDIEIFKK